MLWVGCGYAHCAKATPRSKEQNLGQPLEHQAHQGKIDQDTTGCVKISDVFSPCFLHSTGCPPCVLWSPLQTGVHRPIRAARRPARPCRPGRPRGDGAALQEPLPARATCEAPALTEIDWRKAWSLRLPMGRQTRIDGGGIERAGGGIQIDTRGLVGIQRTCPANQVLRTARPNLPGPGGVRIGQRIAGDRVAAKAPEMQPPGLRTQPGFDIAQPLSAGPLGKRHGEDLAEVH